MLEKVPGLPVPTGHPTHHGGGSPGLPDMAGRLHQQRTSDHFDTLFDTNGPTPIQPQRAGHREGPLPSQEGEKCHSSHREVTSPGLVPTQGPVVPGL